MRGIIINRMKVKTMTAANKPERGAPSADAVECAQDDNNQTKEKMMDVTKRLDREVSNHNVREAYKIAAKSLCPETWDKFCDALNELCERRGMDNSFMGVNAKARTWELR